MGGFSTWLYYLFVRIFVYCTIVVQIANKLKKNINTETEDRDLWNTPLKLAQVLCNT
jgi:hypothetical protein